MDPKSISVGQLAKRLDRTYHTVLHWIKSNRFGVKQYAKKVGWGWVVEERAVAFLREQLKQAGQ